MVLLLLLRVLCRKKLSAISFQLKTYAERQSSRAAEKFVAAACVVQQRYWRLAVGKNTNVGVAFAVEGIVAAKVSFICRRGRGCGGGCVPHLLPML
jgi:hypothetical protein